MENISVSVRVRPLNKLEQSEGFAWKIDGNTVVQCDPNSKEIERIRDTKYTLDHIFAPGKTTRHLYQATTQHLIAKLVHGFNSTVFAYGQTSSGKTYTMRGTPEDPGIISLAVQEVFALIEQTQDREFLIRVSYMELYNEEVNDLLAPENLKLPIHESKESGVYVAGLREDIVTSPAQVLALLEEGESNRHIGATKMNEGSSRSHTVFRMVIESRACNAESTTDPDAGAILVSTLTLVDLAGSERVAKTGAEGIRMKEGTAINKSLLTLGTVINKLSEGAQVTGSHIPYRDSKLTRILQPSLGGNAKTAIICNITPAACHVEESHSTLRFACRAKRVVNNAVVNEVLSDAAVLKRQAKEIEELKGRLASHGMSDVEEKIGVLRAQLLRSEQEKELMRIKLEEETAEREKAQKQVEFAKKIMFAQQKDDIGSKKQSRRETWCPGQSAWAPPGAVAGGTGQGRKRPLQELGLICEDEAGTPSSSRTLDQVAEDAEEGGMPSAQRMRHSDADADTISVSAMESEYPMEPTVQLPASVHVRRSTSSACKVEADEPAQHSRARVQQLEAEADSLQQTLLAAAAEAEEQQQKISTLEQKAEVLTQEKQQTDAVVADMVAEKQQLLPQLEQSRWQCRQLEKKIEELQTTKEGVEKDNITMMEKVESLTQSLALQQEQMEAKLKEAAAQQAELKAQVTAANASLADVQGQLDLDRYERGLLEGRNTQHQAELQEQLGKMKTRSEELDKLKKSLQEHTDKLAAAEDRARELYDSNKRLEEHVHDLESRKRAPLYQKKQEEELKAAIEKAQEADLRAQAAELHCKEAKEALDAAAKLNDELREEMSAAKKLAAEASAKATDQHAVELQKMTVEQKKLQGLHDAALAEAHNRIEQLAKDSDDLNNMLKEKDVNIQHQQEQVTTLQVQLAEAQNSLADSQACASAAKAQIEVLEQAAEAAAVEHQQAMAAAEEVLAQAKLAAAQQLQQTEEQLNTACAKVQAELEATREAAADEVQQLQASLVATNELLTKAMEIAAVKDTEIAAAQAAHQAEMDQVQAKLAEASGVLNAKEELREARMKHKQELAAVRSEMQKLVQESKSGLKGKDAAEKELEAAKKKLLDVETKLKAVLQDKQAIALDKANLERQLKQHSSRATMLEKNLEKKDALDSKRRDSMMVGLNKTKEQLSGFEERCKQLSLDLQRTQMDLMAKTGECHSVEEKLKEVQASEVALKAQKAQLEAELGTTQEQLTEAATARDLNKEEVETLTAKLAALEEASLELDANLRQLRAEHSKVTQEKLEHEAELSQLHAATKQLRADQQILEDKLAALQPAHDELQQMYQQVQAELQLTKASLQKAEAARVHAEGRLPEIGALQSQITSAHEELSDLQFKWDEDRISAAAKEQQLLADKTKLQQQLDGISAQNVKLQKDHQAAVTKTGQQEKQLQELYELCMSQQSKLQSLMEEKQALELQVDNANNEQQKLKAQVTALDSVKQELMATVEDNKVTLHQLQQTADDAQQQATSQAAELEKLRHQAAVEVQAWQDRLEIIKKEQAAAVGELQKQLDQAYQELSDMQFQADQDKVAAEAELQKLQEKLQDAAAQNIVQVVHSRDGHPHRLQEVLEELAAVSKHNDQLSAHLQQAKQELQAAMDSVTQLTLQVNELQASNLSFEGLCTELECLLSEYNEIDVPQASAVATLQHAIVCLRHNLTKAVQQASDMEQVRQALLDSQEHCTSVQQQHADAEQQCLDLQQQLASVQAQLPTQQDASAAFQQQVAPLEQWKSEAEALCANLQQQVSDLQGELAAKETTCSHLQQQVCQSAQAVEAAQQLQRQVDMLQYELEQQQHLLHPPTPTTSNAHLKWEITGLGDQLREVQASRHIAEQKLVTSEKLLVTKEQEIAQLQQQLSVLQAQALQQQPSYAAIVKREVQQGSNDLEESLLHETAPPTACNAPDLQQQVLDLQQHLVIRMEEVASISALVHSGQEVAGMEQLQKQLTAQTSEVTRLTTALEAATCEAADARQTARAAEQQVQALQSQLADSSCQAMEAPVLQQMLEDYQRQVAELKTQLLAAQTETALLHQLTAQQADIELAHAKQQLGELQQLRNTVCELEAKLGALQLENGELNAVRQQVISLTSQLAAAQAEGVVKQMENEDREQELIDELKAEVARLKGDLSLKEYECNGLYPQLHAFAEHIDELCAKIEQLESKLKDMQDIYKFDSECANAMRDQIKELQEELQEQAATHRVEVDKLRSFAATMKNKAAAEIEARLAHDAQQKVQIEALMKQLSEAPKLHDAAEFGTAQAAQDALHELREVAEAKEAELNAKVLRLESQIHWLSQENRQLKAAGASGAAGTGDTAGGGAVSEEVQARISALESELRKSKRAEQKLQALIFRLRKDLHDSGTDPNLFDKLKDTRSLEFDVDLLSNKCKKYESVVKQADVDKQQLQQQFLSLQKKFKSFAAAANKAEVADKENQTLHQKSVL